MNFKKISLRKNIKTEISLNLNNKNPIKFTVLAILGIGLGAVCETFNSDVYETIRVNYVDYLGDLSRFSISELLINSIACNSILLFFSMLLGLCAVGYFFLYIIPFFKGLGIGCVCSYIYSIYAMKGVWYCAVLVFPVALIQLIAIILSCSESYLMSKELLYSIDGRKKEDVKTEIDLYILRYIVFLIIMIVSCIIYIFICRVFKNIAV